MSQPTGEPPTDEPRYGEPNFSALPPRPLRDDLDISITNRPGHPADQPARPRQSAFDDDEFDISISKPSRFPVIVLVAAILWILSGAAFLLLFLLMRLLQVPFAASEIWMLVAAGFYVKDGIQLLLGRFRDPLGDGIICVGIGVFVLGRTVFEAVPGVPFLVTLIHAALGLMFLVPGVLVLVGRRSYLRWRTEQGY